MATLAYVLLCWLLADLLSGIGHWAEDRYFQTDWPWIGKYVAAPNELHHQQPTAFLFHNYWQRNWTTIAAASLAFALTFPSKWSLIFVFASQANEIHAWAHSRGSRWIRVFQEIGLIQSAIHHGRHHRSPFEIRYCVMTNWLNPVLDECGAWRKLEWMLARVGVHPKP